MLLDTVGIQRGIRVVSPPDERQQRLRELPGDACERTSERGLRFAWLGCPEAEDELLVEADSKRRSRGRLLPRAMQRATE
jgi:hypothetical protein